MSVFVVLLVLAIEHAVVEADMEHPPVAGTALAIAMTGYSKEKAIAVVTSLVILGLIHKVAGPYIKHLI